MKSPLQTRREFLEFLGQSAAAASLASAIPFLSACSSAAKSTGSTAGSATAGTLPFIPLAPSTEDKLLLPEGFHYDVVLKWGDRLNEKGDLFGTHNDYLCFLPLNKEGTDGMLWVNHEYLQPLFVSGWTKGQKKTRAQVEKEQQVVGGSLVRIKKNAAGKWEMVANDPHNRRFTAQTMIPIVAPRPIMGSKTAMGTFANCAGGYTPWGTILTCEENYDGFYGEAVYENGKRRIEPGQYRWNEIMQKPPEHYGWVVEVHPLTGQAKKLTALGRFAHEAATVRPTADGRVVVYTGDDGEDRCLYKFIADKPGSLETGTLYVANVEQGRWIPLTLKDHPELKKHFKDQLEVMIRCREAAPMVGGSLLDRPEDIEIDPRTGAVLIALTNSKKRKNHYGSILKIEEKNNDPLALEFKPSTFLPGGPETGFAYPDNMAFDRNGNLWMVTDISGPKIGKGRYEPFGNNSLFYIPTQGENAGRVFRVASAPKDAEFTGPFFSPDGRTLFLSVQHPGELTDSMDQFTSHWPEGGDKMPRSAVVAISGPALDKLVEGSGVKPIFPLPVLQA